MVAAETERLPQYLAPLPTRVESVALRYAWGIVAINLAGTAFGVWYYELMCCSMESVPSEVIEYSTARTSGTARTVLTNPDSASVGPSRTYSSIQYWS